MKTMLNLSLLLMLLAGSAGAVDFYKMYKTGAIKTIYQTEEPVVAHNSSAVLTPAGEIERPKTYVEPSPSFGRLVENIEFDPEIYSRGMIVKEEEVILEELEADTAIVEPLPVTVAAAMEPEQPQVSPEFIEMVVAKDSAAINE